MNRWKYNVKTHDEIPGMILLCNLEGAMQFDCSKDMSVHVSTCTSYDFNVLIPVTRKLWH